MKGFKHCLRRATSRRWVATQTARRLTRPVSVAPMVDISTPHFLELLHIISGPRYAYYTEMHFSRAILEHANRLHAFLGPPRPNVIVQLGGSDSKEMAQAATILASQGYHEINVNVGCPSKAVQHGQFGAVLMKSPELVAEIVKEMQKAVQVPITLKCRLGVDKLDSFDFLHTFVDTVVARTSTHLPHLIVHARKCLLKGLSPKQNRNVPPLNYDRVFELASTFPDIPISINGGFTEASDIKNVLGRVDGCMIGRKIMNSPLFLQDLDHVVNKIPKEQQKPLNTILSEYIDYVELLPHHQVHTSGAARLPPMTILTKPLTVLFNGHEGRAFRRSLADELRRPEQGIAKIVKGALTKADIPIDL